MRVLEIYNELKNIKHTMKVLEAKKNKLREETIKDFLVGTDEIMGAEGLVIITYKAHTENRFQTDIFKDERSELYKQYCLESIVKRFEIK